MVRPRLGVRAAQPAETVVAAARRTVPWSLQDLRRLVRTFAVGLTGLVVAWLVASGTTDLVHQEYAVAGGIVATAVAVTGLAGWLLAGVRALRAERAQSLPQIRELIARRSPETAPVPAQAVDGPVTAPGMTHYHDAACLMVRGKAAQPADVPALLPCPICTEGAS